MLVVQKGNDRKGQLRRMSMLGTALFGFGIIAAIGCILTGSVWLVAVTVVLLAPGIVMLYRVGKSLP
jgi:hypothetical protein